MRDHTAMVYGCIWKYFTIGHPVTESPLFWNPQFWETPLLWPVGQSFITGSATCSTWSMMYTVQKYTDPTWALYDTNVIGLLLHVLCLTDSSYRFSKLHIAELFFCLASIQNRKSSITSLCYLLVIPIFRPLTPEELARRRELARLRHEQKMNTTNTARGPGKIVYPP